MEERHKTLLRRELKRHGRVQDIPQSVWDRIKSDMESEEVAALVLLAIAIGDDWTTDELGSQDARTRGYTQDEYGRYGMVAQRQVQVTAAQTTDTLRDRLRRRIEDQRTSGRGAVGELTDQGIEDALEDVFTPQRRETIATDATTQGFSVGQRGAAERIGRDGARADAGQRVSIELYWETERDDRVCSRCSPLQGQPESVWGQVFPDGPGPAAHPRCRCYLRPVVVVE
jgi:hypothetical protein